MMQIECYKCDKTTSHQTKWLGGEKESGYFAKCRICGKEGIITRYEIDRQKQINISEGK